MEEWARKKSADIPAKFKIVEAGEYKLYQPTPIFGTYIQKFQNRWNGK